MFRILVAGVLLFMSIGASIAAPVPGSGVSVRETGAVGDGVADDTAAFEAAIAQAKTSGETVTVPAGKYRLTRTLTLETQAMVGAVAAAWVADASPLPTIVPEAKDGPCIRLKQGGSVHGIHFAYNWGNEKPSPRPATIELAGVGCRVSDVKIHGAWDAIMADGKNNVGRTIIEHCFIVDVHNVGVRMTGTWDSSWISKVEVWSPSSPTFPKTGVGFLIGKNDVLMVSDCFVFNAQTGYKLLDKIPGCEIKGPTWGTFSNCAADFSSIAAEVNGAHTVSFVGGTYWTHFGGMVVDGKGAQVRVSGAEFGANGAPALQVKGGDLVTVSACQIRRISKGFTAPAVSVTGGRTTVVTGCVITSSTKGTEVKPGLKNVVLANNVVRENEVPVEEKANSAPAAK